MENKHIHRFNNTGDREDEIAGVDVYKWRCFDCGHIEFATDDGYTLKSEKLNQYGESYEQRHN